MPRGRQKKMVGFGRMSTITSKKQFDELCAKSGDKPILIDFTATWSAPCKRMAPFIADLSRRPEFSHITFVKIDVDHVADVAKLCEVKSLPTFQVWVNGVKAEGFSGASPAKLLEMLKNHAKSKEEMESKGKFSLRKFITGSVKGFFGGLTHPGFVAGCIAFKLAAVEAEGQLGYPVGFTQRPQDVPLMMLYAAGDMVSEWVRRVKLGRRYRSFERKMRVQRRSPRPVRVAFAPLTMPFRVGKAVAKRVGQMVKPLSDDEKWHKEAFKDSKKILKMVYGKKWDHLLKALDEADRKAKVEWTSKREAGNWHSFFTRPRDRSTPETYGDRAARVAFENSRGESKSLLAAAKRIEEISKEEDDADTKLKWTLFSDALTSNRSLERRYWWTRSEGSAVYNSIMGMPFPPADPDLEENGPQPRLRDPKVMAYLKHALDPKTVEAMKKDGRWAKFMIQKPKPYSFNKPSVMPGSKYPRVYMEPVKYNKRGYDDPLKRYGWSSEDDSEARAKAEEKAKLAPVSKLAEAILDEQKQQQQQQQEEEAAGEEGKAPAEGQPPPPLPVAAPYRIAEELPVPGKVVETYEAATGALLRCYSPQELQEQAERREQANQYPAKEESDPDPLDSEIPGMVEERVRAFATGINRGKGNWQKKPKAPRGKVPREELEAMRERFAAEGDLEKRRKADEMLRRATPATGAA